MEELIRIEGSVSAVVFQNAENGYTVLRLKDGKGETTTVVGTVPDTNVGERLRVEGRWSSHSTYGKQLEIVNLERLMPESRIEILAMRPTSVLIDCSLSYRRAAPASTGNRFPSVDPKAIL